jgi:hexosaminidase
MKKPVKIFSYVFTGMLCLFLIIILILNGYYHVLENRQLKRMSMRKSVTSEKRFATSMEKGGVAEGTLNLIPVPKKVVFAGGSYTMPDKIVFSVSDSLAGKAGQFLKILHPETMISPSGEHNLVFTHNGTLPVQGYKLSIFPGRITIEYSHPEGMWYALVTLKVLKTNYAGIIPCVTIEDQPDLEVRGVMLDISRDKVPTRETLLGIARLLSDLKYNHFELYMEGFSFAYPSFKHLWEGKETPLSGEDIEVLDVFCKNHFIDLVPNQNSLGHMTQWLATGDFKELAECPNGHKLMGMVLMKGTLDPNDPRSLELVSQMSDDLLPHFSSGSFNVNLDEPFELGMGKNKKLAEQTGVGKIYLDYALKMHKMVSDRGKKMLMWADIVLKHPDLIPQIPKEITLLDWGYEAAYPFEKHGRMLQQAGLTWMVCPGTNSWTTLTGRTDNMLATISSAARNGVAYGAKGMLLTDWGDMGHWQYLPVSYAGYTTGAALSWNSRSENEMPLAEYLNSYVFRDKNGIMGDLALDLGRYCRFEEFPMVNMTTTMLAFQLGLRDKVMIDAIMDKMVSGLTSLMAEIAPETVAEFKKQYETRGPFDYQGLNDFLLSKEKLLAESVMTIPDSILVKEEYMNAIRLIRLGSGLKNHIETSDAMPPADQITQLKALRELGTKYLEENKQLWLARNKPGGYQRSTAALYTLMDQIDQRIAELHKPAFLRWLDKLLKRAGTAGAAIYLGAV